MSKKDYDFLDGLFGGSKPSQKDVEKQKEAERNAHARGVQTGFRLAQSHSAKLARQLGYDTLAAEIEKLSVQKK